MITVVVIVLAVLAVSFAYLAFEVRAAGHAPVTAEDVNAAADMWAGASQQATGPEREDGDFALWAAELEDTR